jgi:pimeloyl-ACP methyl ester carboxylesterase
LESPSARNARLWRQGLVAHSRAGSHKGAPEQSRFFTLRNSGHFSSVENPQEVARIILSGHSGSEAEQLQS